MKELTSLYRHCLDAVSFVQLSYVEELDVTTGCVHVRTCSVTLRCNRSKDDLFPVEVDLLLQAILLSCGKKYG